MSARNQVMMKVLQDGDLNKPKYNLKPDKNEN